MNARYKPKTKVDKSMRVGLKPAFKKQVAPMTNIRNGKHNFQFCYDGIEVHSCDEFLGFHVWIVDINIRSNIFDECGDNYEEVIEHAMQCLGEYKHEIQRSIEGSGKAIDMLGRAFLEGGIELTDDERVEMEGHIGYQSSTVNLDEFIEEIENLGE